MICHEIIREPCQSILIRIGSNCIPQIDAPILSVDSTKMATYKMLMFDTNNLIA